MPVDDTIFAVAAGGARSAITVLRISGPHASKIVGALCRRLPEPRVASLRTLKSRTGEILDRSIVTWFPAPGSYTGEDSAELHLHGGRAVLDATIAAVAASGARPALAGEFTRRAFINGKMDLLEAEAIADLVEAETEGQRRQALRQMQGALGTVYKAWTDRLLTLLAHQEALIDFPDEDLPEELAAQMSSEIAALRLEIEAHLVDGRRGERIHDGLTFVIIGAPNVGKSSLMNALADRDVALVSHIPGTTRDALEARLVLAGVPVTLIDTAGLRETADLIEAAGVKRAVARASSADCVILVGEAGGEVPACQEVDSCLLLVANKIDVSPTPQWADLGVSAETGVGIAEFKKRLDGIAASLTEMSETPPLTRLRHRQALERASSALNAAIHAPLPELCGEDLRIALFALGTLQGHVGVEAVLDVIFGQFCIGK